MPHRCTNCGRQFDDGSKQMLSGCPDCGGNKFEFQPPGRDTGPTDNPAPTTDDPAATTDDTAPTTDDPAATTDDPAATTDESAATATDPATTTDQPTASTANDPVGDVAGTVDEADVTQEPPERSKERRRQRAEEDPGQSTFDEMFREAEADEGVARNVDYGDELDQTADSEDDLGQTAEPEHDPSQPTNADDGIGQDAEIDDEVGQENTAQSEARSSSVTMDEINEARGQGAGDETTSRAEDEATSTERARGTPQGPPTETPSGEERAAFEVGEPFDDAPDGDRSADDDQVDSGPAPGATGEPPEPVPEENPDLQALRAELNDQFESIKITEPGRYELNLMELFERKEYIISLQEDGRYVIEMAEDYGMEES